MCRWEASFDFQKVPVGNPVELFIESQGPGPFFEGGEGSSTYPIEVDAETAELSHWFLLPEGQRYRDYRIVRHETGKPGTVEQVKVVSEYLADDSTILAFKLLSVKPGYTYEIQWYYK
jgi:hypothetical protein